MENFSIDGTAKMTGGEYATVDIDGVVDCTGDLKAETIKIDGVFKCRGRIDAGVFECDGTAKFDSAIIAKKVDVDGFAKMERLEADEIHCNGAIQAAKEISADLVSVDGCISAREIVGDAVKINSCKGKFLSSFPGKRSKIDLIEATTIELRGVAAQTVNGKDIKIGPRCRIQNIDCSGTLSIDEKAEVHTVTGNYTMV